MVAIINERQFANMIKNNTSSNNTRPLVVDCFTDWCAPCRAAAPYFEKLSVKYKDYADFIKINVDLNPGVARKLSVRGVPTFVILVGNRVKGRIVGVDMRKLEGTIRKIIKERQDSI